MIELPKLYPILDAEALARAGVPLVTAARALHDAGLRWVQYRDKQASDAAVEESMRELRAIFPAGEAVLLLNDRVHLCGQTEADGVHIGQQDMAPAEARHILGPKRLLGSLDPQRRAATRGAPDRCAGHVAPDYVAIGPVYTTGSKKNADPVVGLKGVRAARALTRLPLVAIGGIIAGNAAEVIEAGADAVAVISALLPKRDRGMAETVTRLSRTFYDRTDCLDIHRV